ncbi:MAG: GntR family transcriptional regulator [Armatimonadota bacterium]
MGLSGIEQPTWSQLWGEPPLRETVRAVAYRQLRDAILHGRIPMGARINELDLATAWKVSRTPIRDALRRLEAEGLVQAVPGKGVVVPRLGLSDADELYELREVLEGRAAMRAAQRATSEFQSRLNALIKAFGAALKRGDLDAMAAIDLELHGGIAAMSGSSRLERAIDAVRSQVYPVRLRTFRMKGRGAKSFREMAKLTAAIRARNGPRAEASMREHIASLRADLAGLLQALEE